MFLQTCIFSCWRGSSAIYAAKEVMLRAPVNNHGSRLNAIVFRRYRPLRSSDCYSLSYSTTKSSRKRSIDTHNSTARPLISAQLTNRNHQGATPNEAVNPPASCRPPLLELPPTDPTAPFYKRYFTIGRAYLAFYKAGFKQIFENVKIARKLPLSPSWSIPKNLKEGRITRAQYHLLLRTRSDISRIPLFALVFLVCGEFTPLLVPFLSPIVPKTLWLPSQWEKARWKAEGRRRRWNRLRLRDQRSASDGGPPSSAPSLLPEESRYEEGVRLNAWPRWCDATLIRWLPASMVNKRVEKVSRNLLLDSFAIDRDGDVDGMVDDEVKMALDARGCGVIGKDMADLRRTLQQEVAKSRSEWAGEMKSLLSDKG